jgi:hypothetical protein
VVSAEQRGSALSGAPRYRQRSQRRPQCIAAFALPLCGIATCKVYQSAPPYPLLR